MALDLNAAMDAIGARLETIAGLRVRPYAAENIAPPTAMVQLPENVEYDTAFARGADRVVIPVDVLVSKVSDRTARARLGAYISGIGAKSIKTALDGDLNGVAQTARVTDARVQVFTVAQVDYLGATFNVEVYS